MSLSPCPFCSREPEMRERQKPYAQAYGIGCENIDCEIAPWTRWHPTQAAALAVWNTRKAAA